MKIKNILREEFEDFGRTVFGKESSIYKNPTSREMKDLMKETDDIYFRFIIDLKNKNVYVFDENLLHQSVAKKLGMKYKDDINKRVFGQGKYLPSNRKISSKKVQKLKLAFDDEKKEWLSKWFEL